MRFSAETQQDGNRRNYEIKEKAIKNRTEPRAGERDEPSAYQCLCLQLAGSADAPLGQTNIELPQIALPRSFRRAS
jgi:hypothetical protein